MLGFRKWISHMWPPQSIADLIKQTQSKPPAPPVVLQEYPPPSLTVLAWIMHLGMSCRSCNAQSQRCPFCSQKKCAKSHGKKSLQKWAVKKKNAIGWLDSHVVPKCSMYRLFTYITWKMATFKRKWLSKYSHPMEHLRYITLLSANMSQLLRSLHYNQPVQWKWGHISPLLNFSELHNSKLVNPSEKNKFLNL